MQSGKSLHKVMGVVLLVITTTVGMPGSAFGDEEGAQFVPVSELELRPTNALGHWELVDPEGLEEPRVYVETESFALLPLAGMEHAGLAARFSAVLVGQVDGEEGYSVGVMGEAGTGESASGRAFIVFARASSRASAVTTAREFAEGYNRQSPGYLPELPADPIPLCDCEDCGQILVEETNACSLQNNLCIGVVVSEGITCGILCGGVPLCEAACATAVVLGIWHCNSVHASCVRAATDRFKQCEATCNP